MSIKEGFHRFIEQYPEKETHRHPAVVILEFGGGYCNKAGEPSCRDFCAVPEGKIYDPTLDPRTEDLASIFRQIASLEPAIVSLVPNGELLDTINKSNTYWGEVNELAHKDIITQKQLKILTHYFRNRYQNPFPAKDQPMTPAEKAALTIATGTNYDVNISLTTNGAFLGDDLLTLYSQMGLQAINLSYHPNRPFNPGSIKPDLEHLIARANEAIRVGIIPTITHVLTRDNADTYVALSDYVTKHDILFAVGIAQARGGSFSTDYTPIEPTTDQVKTVFRRLLARKLFADRHIRTTNPYLFLAPYLRNWVCDQTTDFFHISFEKRQDHLIPMLNVCSEVRPQSMTSLDTFVSDGRLDISTYLQWREKVLKDPDNGCPTCTHQCFFEAEMRGLDFSDTVQMWDYWDIIGKGLRQKYTFRHPVRPTVSRKEDLQNPLLWESLLQGITRYIAYLASDERLQATFTRSGDNINEVITSCIQDARDPFVIQQLVQSEFKVYEFTPKWHDAKSLQSRALKATYDRLWRGDFAIPLKFRNLLRHQSDTEFENEIINIANR